SFRLLLASAAAGLGVDPGVQVCAAKPPLPAHLEGGKLTLLRHRVDRLFGDLEKPGHLRDGEYFVGHSFAPRAMDWQRFPTLAKLRGWMVSRKINLKTIDHVTSLSFLNPFR